MERKIFKEYVDFFNSLTVEEIDITSEQENSQNQKVVIVNYFYGPHRFTTKKLYYRLINDLDNVDNKSQLLNFFKGSVYWLDLEKHKWPQGSGESDLEKLVIPDMVEDGDHEFFNFLIKLANNAQTGFIQKITSDGRSAQYYHNLENNNHWHDLIIFIKEAISAGGKSVAENLFSRLVFKWNGNKKTERKRASLSPNATGQMRSIVFRLYENISSMKEIIIGEKMKSLLNLKKQIVLQGPPGTGKTFLAKDLAEIILFGDISYDKQDQATKLEKSGRFKLVQFHPSYTYDDFVRGIQVDPENGSFRAVNKVFGEFCNLALKNYLQSKPDMPNSFEVDKQEWLDDEIIREVKDPDPYVFIIDEINRANLPSVLGELIYALEYRDKPVESMYALSNSGNSLIIPSNLLIIGTMNTADRSVGHIDYAIRRRFAFVDVSPNEEVIKNVNKDPNTQINALALFHTVSGLFVDKYLNSDFKPHEVQLGHSYFLAKNEATLALKLEYEIKPLLKEYIKDGILNENATDIVNSLSI